MPKPEPQTTRDAIISELATQIAIESNTEGKLVVKNSRMRRIEELLYKFAEDIRRCAQ